MFVSIWFSLNIHINWENILRPSLPATIVFLYSLYTICIYWRLPFSHVVLYFYRINVLGPPPPHIVCECTSYPSEYVDGWFMSLFGGSCQFPRRLRPIYRVWLQRYILDSGADKAPERLHPPVVNNGVNCTVDWCWKIKHYHPRVVPCKVGQFLVNLIMLLHVRQPHLHTRHLGADLRLDMSQVYEHGEVTDHVHEGKYHDCDAGVSVPLDGAVSHCCPGFTLQGDCMKRFR